MKKSMTQVYLFYTHRKKMLMECSDSQNEGFAYRDLYGVHPVSAVSIIQYAYTVGVPVDNGWTDADPRTDDIYMQGGVQYYDWGGTAWICNDDCASCYCGYMISGGLHGGSMGEHFGALFGPDTKLHSNK